MGYLMLAAVTDLNKKNGGLALLIVVKANAHKSAVPPGPAWAKWYRECL
jgi:hypothetical protein